MKGRVEKFNDDDAFGSLIAHAEKGGDTEWTKVHCVLSIEPPPLREEELTPGTYSHRSIVNIQDIVRIAKAYRTKLGRSIKLQTSFT